MAELISQAQWFWKASGDYAQHKWEWIHDDVFGGNEWAMGVPGTIIIGSIAFFLYNVPFLIIDTLNWPKWIVNLRIQKDRSYTKKDLWDAIKMAAFNDFVVGYLIAEPFYRISKWNGRSDFGRTLPTAGRVIQDILVCTLFYEFVFYYLHRALHYKWFYKWIHKEHHEWTAPVSVISFYVHPLEHFLVNFFASLGAPMVFGMHIASVWAFLIVAVWAAVLSHSGYHLPLPGAVSPEAHDFHHSAFIYNFAPLGIFDRIHGTDKVFREKAKYQEHLLFLATGKLTDAAKQEKNKEKKEKKRE